MVTRLRGKRVVLLVADGVEEEEVVTFREHFEHEGAEVFTTTPLDQEVIATVAEHGMPGRPITIDIPFEIVFDIQFDGVIIPDGVEAVQSLRDNQRVIRFVALCHKYEVPLFASGSAAELLYASRVLSEAVLVREGTPMKSFVDQATQLILGVNGGKRWPLATG